MSGSTEAHGSKTPLPYQARSLAERKQSPCSIRCVLSGSRATEKSLTIGEAVAIQVGACAPKRRHLAMLERAEIPPTGVQATEHSGESPVKACSTLLAWGASGPVTGGTGCAPATGWLPKMQPGEELNHTKPERASQ